MLYCKLMYIFIIEVVPLYVFDNDNKFKHILPHIFFLNV